MDEKEEIDGALLKLDLQSAYDSVRWVVLDHIIEIMSFGRKWRCWIKSYITSASISVIVNGSLLKPLKM